MSWEMLKHGSLIVSTAFAAVSVEAQSVKLQAREITTHMAAGDRSDTPYRQYFGKDIATSFAQESAMSTAGKWRVDPKSHACRSTGPRDADRGEGFVTGYAGGFYWAGITTPSPPFRVRKGQQLVFHSEKAGHAFCASLDQFMAPVTAGTKAEDQINLPVSGAPKPLCGTSIAASGQVSRHCHWSFDYRSEAAKDTFATILNVTSICLDEKEASQSAPHVNHPDSYDLRAFDVEEGTLIVSLKDKGALQKTVIFLRMERD